MKRLLAAIYFCLAFTAACGTTGQPVLTTVSHVVDCTVDQVRQQIPSIVDDAATCLVGGNYLACLTQLGTRVGEDAMLCAVALAGSEAGHRMAMSPMGAQPNASAIREHAESYLTARDVRFSQ